MKFSLTSVAFLVACLLPQVELSYASGIEQNYSDYFKPSLRRHLALTSYGLDCGCSASCTTSVLNLYAGDYKVGGRIKWLMDNKGKNEREACTTVCESEFPTICGAQCDPSLCEMTNPKPNPNESPCACDSCTETVLDSNADGFTCRSRINWLMTERSFSEYNACVRVSEEFPSICGPNCNPSKCASTLEPSKLPTKSPSMTPTISPTPAPSESPSKSPTKPPTMTPTKQPTNVPSPPPIANPTYFPCRCESCTQSVLDAIAYDGNGGFSCDSRMNWLMTTQDMSETAACARVSNEFPDVCGPHCDPNLCNPVYVPDPDPNNLIWSDEFDTDGPPDSSLWDYDIGGGGWGNNELQYYTDRSENAYVSGGVLHVRAVKENYQNREYTSARLVTRNIGDWTYGRVLVRARLLRCTGLGTWPAIWMLPTDWFYGGWPDSGEIDIMEHVGYDTGRVHGTVHTRAYNHGSGTQKGSSINTDISDWHVYEIIWASDRIDFVMDGVKYHEFAKDAGATYREWPFDKRFHLLLNVAVGGMWGGAKGVDSSAFEGDGQTMEVDWVRVYSS